MFCNIAGTNIRKMMISYEKASELIRENVICFESEKISLEDAVHRYLAEDIQSPIDLPGFDQSAMDGYAVGKNKGEHFTMVSGEIKAGDSSGIILEEGEALRIFTGASVPSGSERVIPQEYVAINGNVLSFENARFSAGANIRYKGDHQRKGELALKKGVRLTPAACGFLASVGISEVAVFKLPRVGIITSGNELKKAGSVLNPGEIYESNSFTIRSFLKESGINNFTHLVISDDKNKTDDAIRNALQENDILILTGGMSVGDYDFVYPSLKEAGVMEVFYKVNQKPGKPVFFGKYGHKPVFGLPGNPAAVLTCLYLYFYPVYLRMMGSEKSGMTKTTLKLTESCQKPMDQTRFLKGNAKSNQVEILKGQESHMLKSYVEANCLIYLPAGCEIFKSGDEVSVFWLQT
jgi:molybdopterin molybdotransferase